jgi:hypothetical protein
LIVKVVFQKRLGWRDFFRTTDRRTHFANLPGLPDDERRGIFDRAIYLMRKTTQHCENSHGISHALFMFSNIKIKGFGTLGVKIKSSAFKIHFIFNVLDINKARKRRENTHDLSCITIK